MKDTIIEIEKVDYEKIEFVKFRSFANVYENCSMVIGLQSGKKIFFDYTEDTNEKWGTRI